LGEGGGAGVLEEVEEGGAYMFAILVQMEGRRGAI
jgi:hypothetical protein